MIARKKPRPLKDVDSDEEHRRCLKNVIFESTIDTEVMENKSIVTELHKVSSPDADYLVLYKANGSFRGFNYLMDLLHILDRQDLFHIYELITKRYLEVTLEGYELILWGNLKGFQLTLLHGEELASPGSNSSWGKGNADTSHALEGHVDNEGGLSGPQIRPSPVHPSGRRRDILEEPAPKNVVPDAEASYSAGRFGNLPFTPQWGLTDSSRMDNSSNVLLRFEALKEQHADLVYAHESCTDVKAHFKECRKELAVVKSAYDEKVSASDQLSKNYDGVLTREKSLQDRLEELEEEKKEADNLNSSQADRIKQLEEALKQAEADAKQLRSEKVHYAVEAGKGEIVRQKIVNQYLPTFVRRLHQSAEYKRSLGQVFSLAVGKGFIDSISIGREEEDIQTILEATPNVDPASSETFLPAYEKLFDQRYPYVDKVARMYLLDPTELQNIMPDETGPTPGRGPRDTCWIPY
ncbi:hypothetical protein Tco_1389633 [Tanacetum coccineum]